MSLHQLNHISSYYLCEGYSQDNHLFGLIADKSSIITFRVTEYVNLKMLFDLLIHYFWRMKFN
jgi:hypothetical protein